MRGWLQFPRSFRAFSASCLPGNGSLPLSAYASLRAQRIMYALEGLAPAATSNCWLSDEELADVYPYEDWVLARSAVGAPPEGELEDDLFAGIREAS